MARPAKFNPDVHISKARELMAQGATRAALAEAFGIGERTLYEWIERYPQLAQAVKEGSDVADGVVVSALYKSACGFTGPDGKYYPPSQTAQIYWLKNRQPDKWRDKREHSTEIKLTELSEEEIEKRLVELLREAEGWHPERPSSDLNEGDRRP